MFAIVVSQLLSFFRTESLQWKFVCENHYHCWSVFLRSDLEINWMFCLQTRVDCITITIISVVHCNKRGTKSLRTPRDSWRKHHQDIMYQFVVFDFVTLYGVYSIVILTAQSPFLTINNAKIHFKWQKAHFNQSSVNSFSAIFFSQNGHSTTTLI